MYTTTKVSISFLSVILLRIVDKLERLCLEDPALWEEEHHFLNSFPLSMACYSSHGGRMEVLLSEARAEILVFDFSVLEVDLAILSLVPHSKGYMQCMYYHHPTFPRKVFWISAQGLFTDPGMYIWNQQGSYIISGTRWVYLKFIHWKKKKN